jgi:hydrogenase nickel incorporation protein HypA/HybF
MHELSIALNILDLAAEEAERRNARVAAVHLQLGPLSGVVKEALLSAYELARDGPLKDSRLVVEEMPIIVRCPRCRADRPAKSLWQICCSVCGTPTPEVIGGRELQIVALEVCDDHADASCANSTESAQAE